MALGMTVVNMASPTTRNTIWNNVRPTQHHFLVPRSIIASGMMVVNMARPTTRNTILNSLHTTQHHGLGDDRGEHGEAHHQEHDLEQPASNIFTERGRVDVAVL
jgi:hypothetical protein